jgi:multiple sugar transport system permease protein
MLLFSAVMQISSAFSISQLPIALAGYPSVSNKVDTVVSYLADAGTVRYEMGYASAISVFLFLIMIIVRIIVGNMIKRVGK